MKKKIVIILISIFLLTLLLIYFYSKKITPLLMKYAKIEGKKIAIDIISKGYYSYSYTIASKMDMLIENQVKPISLKSGVISTILWI